MRKAAIVIRAHVLGYMARSVLGAAPPSLCSCAWVAPTLCFARSSPRIPPFFPSSVPRRKNVSALPAGIGSAGTVLHLCHLFFNPVHACTLPQSCSAGFCGDLCTHRPPPVTPFPCLQGSPGWAPPTLWVPSFSVRLSTLFSAPPASRFFLTCSSAFAHPLSSPCLFAS